MSRVINGTGGTAASTGYTAIQGTTRAQQTFRPRLGSRRPKNPFVDTPWSPYKWRVPLTWQDGVKYPASDLNQSFITNMDEVPGVLLMMEEDFPVTEDAVWTDITPLSYPIAANESWALTLVLHFWGANYFIPGFRVPAGADATAAGYFFGTGAVAEFQQWAPSSGIYEPIGAFPDGDTDPAAVITIDIVVRNGATQGVFLPTIVPSTPDSATVLRLGSALIGMKL